jgi:acyl-coenzyme A synthetase/AMP-(fatty) acid ligase
VSPPPARRVESGCRKTGRDLQKDLIKYNAHQVAPAELEAVLLARAVVADATVVRSPDEEVGEVPKPQK